MNELVIQHPKADFQPLCEAARDLRRAEALNGSGPMQLAVLAMWNHLVATWNSISTRQARIRADCASCWYFWHEDAGIPAWMPGDWGELHDGRLAAYTRSPAVTESLGDRPRILDEDALVIEDEAGRRHLIGLSRINLEKSELLEVSSDLPWLLDPSSDYVHI